LCPQGYILTIVRHLELPNSCIVASLIYVQRAVVGTRFSLSITNWQRERAAWVQHSASASSPLPTRAYNISRVLAIA